MRYLRRRIVAAVLASGVLAGCGGTSHHTPTARAEAGLTGAPRGIVVLQGHHLDILASLTGTSLKAVDAGTRSATGSATGSGSGGTGVSVGAVLNAAFTTGRAAAVSATGSPSPSTPAAMNAPASADPSRSANAPVFPLAGIRQLSAHLVAGIRGGDTLVAFDPAHPGSVRAVAPAGDWFPDRAGTGAWAVTEPNEPAGACPVVPHTRTQIPRYRLEHRDLASGAVEKAPFLLPCGMRPVADTARGLVVETVRPKTAPVAGALVTDVQLADPTTLHVTRQLARSATVFDAAGGTLLIDTPVCSGGPCERPLVVDGGFRPKVGALPHGGVLAGAGELDPTGRYLASADYTPGGGGRLSLVLCDLRAGTVKDLGAYPSGAQGHAAGRLQTDLPSLWSGTRFLFAAPGTGRLTSYDPTGPRTGTRTGLPTTAPLQVWGAAG
ncbi:hypothetical protein [Streptantibioticus silvisoli]|uniref:Secreted protein n=1 Tax=Streptantibioticus silvisoli TaxID=2705255 RepID=A0ABT6W7V6_9ACTN|nr:hypothetical protein [Streptantibioticus silvisoli]MDI5966833.1 hypothetical protein [Streptantibioticus silvisoli]